MNKDLLAITDLTAEEVGDLLQDAVRIKKMTKKV